MRGGVNLPTRRLAVACQPCPDKSANIETWELERDLGALSCSVCRAGKGRPRACGVTRLRLCTSHVAPRRKQNTVLQARLLGEICAAHSSLLVHLQMNMPQTNALCIPASRMQAHVLSGSPSSPPSRCQSKAHRPSATRGDVGGPAAKEGRLQPPACIVVVDIRSHDPPLRGPGHASRASEATSRSISETAETELLLGVALCRYEAPAPTVRSIATGRKAPRFASSSARIVHQRRSECYGDVGK